jgi:hypothetical protein
MRARFDGRHGEVSSSTWPIWAIPDEDLIWRRCRAAGLMPTDGGGNLITLAGRDGAI